MQLIIKAKRIDEIIQKEYTEVNLKLKQEPKAIVTIFKEQENGRESVSTMGLGREQVENIIETQRKFEENIAMEVK